MDIIALAASLSGAVAAVAERCRRFFYAVMLWGHVCPRCRGRLLMVAEGRCRCRSCGHELDPTVVFQRCTACGGVPALKVSRYSCKQCGADVPSHFLFEGLVFERDYFRHKMAESRQRKTQHRERVRQLLAECRSPALNLPGMADLHSVPGLLGALDQLTQSAETWCHSEGCSVFDLKRYQSHILAHIGEISLSLVEVPSLEDDRRRDLIWRFVAAVFMAHMGLINIWQDGQDIMVMKREAH